MASTDAPHMDLAESHRLQNGGAHSNEEIVIHAVSDTDTIHYTVLHQTKLQAVMDDFCTSVGVFPLSVHFMFNGKKVSGDDTIASLSIELDDCIDVVSADPKFPTTPGKKTTPNSKSSSKRKIPMKHFMQSPLSMHGSSSSSTFSTDMFCDIKKNLFPIGSVNDVSEEVINETMNVLDMGAPSACSGQVQPPVQSAADMLLMHELHELASNSKCARRSLDEQ
jgi:hypothetical protein